MKGVNNKFNLNQKMVPKIKHEPHRVASRMEGVVKNIGIKPIKKPKKQ
jgi:hypothetical protein